MLRLSGTVGSTTLSTGQMPTHGHAYKTYTGTDGHGGELPHVVDHNIISAETERTGGSQSHTHDFTGSSGNANSIPPYYALALLMRIA